MKGLDVICPGCRKSFHTTTEAFTANKNANGAMVRLKDPWRKWGWCSFGDTDNGMPPKMAERPDIYWSMMDCPGCGAPMAPSGKLLVRHTDGSEYVQASEPEPINNLVDGKLVFPVDGSLDQEWDERVKKSYPSIGKTMEAAAKVADHLLKPGKSVADGGKEIKVPLETKKPKKYVCKCGFTTAHSSSLSRHKKKCKVKK